MIFKCPNKQCSNYGYKKGDNTVNKETATE